MQKKNRRGVSPQVGEWDKFVAGFDPHGDKQDPAANAAFFDFVDRYQPDIRVAGGDVFDFRPLRKKADDEEKRESMAKDFEAGMEWLRKLKPTYYTLGNHCQRLWDLADANRGILSDYAQKGVSEIEDTCRKYGCRILPYHKRLGVLQLGHLKIIHGFYAGITAARRTALAYGSVICGHGHGIQHAQIERLEFTVGRMAGCLVQLDMEYNRAHVGTLAHAHGWAYGVINRRSGAFHVAQAQQVDGTWNFELLNL